jgi:phosphoribosylformylglycinamidine cyclo-ligase
MSGCYTDAHANKFARRFSATKRHSPLQKSSSDKAARERALNDDPPPSAAHARAAKANDKIKGLARRTFNKNVLSEIGGFAGFFSLDTARFPDPVLIATADGIGNKLPLAAKLGLHASVAADLVNHCVNDIAVQGATPLYFLDYFGAAHLDPEIVEQTISGLVDACKANGCALLGGETAEMPSLYRETGYDLAGFMTGVVSRPRLLTGDAIQDGDCLLALPSNGLHTTGYRLAQELFFQRAGYTPTQYVNELGDKVGAALMRSHRSYLSPIRKLIQAEVVHAFAHITGGGITQNLPRVLPKGLAVQIDLSTWEPPPLFAHLQKIGEIEREEMFSTFNMGIGMIAFVPVDLVKKARLTLTRMNERSFVIGRVVRRLHRKVIYT